MWFIMLKKLIIHSYNIKNGKIKRLHKSQGQAMDYISYNLSEGNRFNSL